MNFGNECPVGRSRPRKEERQSKEEEEEERFGEPTELTRRYRSLNPVLLLVLCFFCIFSPSLLFPFSRETGVSVRGEYPSIS